MSKSTVRVIFNSAIILIAGILIFHALLGPSVCRANFGEDARYSLRLSTIFQTYCIVGKDVKAVE
jgi:ABC-type Fe3+-siderophore transport system permease subunit